MEMKDSEMFLFGSFFRGRPGGVEHGHDCERAARLNETVTVTVITQHGLWVESRGVEDAYQLLEESECITQQLLEDKETPS